MSLALYIKENPRERVQRTKRRDRTFFGLISALGAIAIIFSVWPYISWQLFTVPKLTAKVDEAPVPQTQVLAANTQFNSSNVQIIKDSDGFSYFTTDFQPQNSTPSARPKQFLLTVPKLKIENALVKVDTINFFENLALFPGTAIPGDIGNSFITGHSVLPEFNDPKNYRTIFTKLSDLEVGDDVIARVGSQTFHFSVLYSKIVDPQDISVLVPISGSGRNLTLMSCVPPGTSSKRLIIVAGLI